MRKTQVGSQSKIQLVLRLREPHGETCPSNVYNKATGLLRSAPAKRKASRDGSLTPDEAEGVSGKH